MKNTEKAFNWIIDILENLRIDYKISGGLAVRAYGSSRELADIDIEVSNENIHKVFEHVKDFVVFGPEFYEDDSWKIDLMTLNYEGQDIDINGNLGEIFNKNTNQWEKISSDLKDCFEKEIFGRLVKVDSVDSLIEYKTKLGREVDLEDVLFLKEN